MDSINKVIPCLHKILFLCAINYVSGATYSQRNDYFDGSRQNNFYNIQTALGKLDHEHIWSPNWPAANVLKGLGQVSGVALKKDGTVLVFHRGDNVWDSTSFNTRYVYQGIGDAPISSHTVLYLNNSGEIIDMWGNNLFYLPHGITVDYEDNIWLTDVAMHQVFKFDPKDRTKPVLTLGEKFVPGSDETHFCKPSAVAVLENGDFFVADGYCNSRIIKHAPDGTRILDWGRDDYGNSVYSFRIPHALALVPDRGHVCVADRENGRASCFRSDNGTHVASYSSWLIGGRVFSVAYAPVDGGRLYLVNGPGAGNGVPVRGYVIDYTSGRLIQTFAPDGDFANPHDLVVSQSGNRIYVAELKPFTVHKFEGESVSAPAQNTTMKPALRSPVESMGPVTKAAWHGWAGAAGGAAGALAAGAAAAAVALLRARNKGRKNAPRRRWEYGPSEFKLRRLLERRRFTRVHSEDSDDEPSPMLPPPHPTA